MSSKAAKGRKGKPARKGPSRPKGGRRRPRKLRLRKLLATMLLLSLLCCAVPFTLSDVPDPPLPSTTYGVYDKLAALQGEKSSRYGSADVLREVRPAMEGMIPHVVERTGPLTDHRLVHPPVPEASAPQIFDSAQNSTDLNGTSIVQWLLQGPLNYWVRTRLNGLETWTQGLLRPSLDLRIDETGIHVVDWEMWVKVDADRNVSTGDEGYELRARLSVVIENATFQRPTLFPPSNEWGFNFTGGVMAQVKRLANATATLPMEVSFLKAFMYRGLNYLWLIDLNYSDLPASFELSILAEKVRAGGSLMDIIGNILSNFSIGNGSLLSDISGPYRVFLNTTALEAVTGTIGFGKTVGQAIEERSWVKLQLEASSGLATIPAKAELWLDSPGFTYSFNHARWSAETRCRLRAEMVLDQENLTYANLSLEDVPSYMELVLTNNSADGALDNLLVFDASSRIPRIEYNEHERYGDDPRNTKSMHVVLTDLPTHIYLRGTFEVGGPSPPAISNNIGIGFIARVLDNSMVRLASKFYTIARTLRSIPENLLRMPENDGWTDLQLPEDQPFGMVELWIASGPYIEREGSYFAFFNLSLPPSDLPLMRVSFSLRLFGLAGLQSDFRKGTHLDIRASAGQALSAVFVDDQRGSNASLEIDALPERLVLDMDRASRKVEVNASAPISSVVYIGQVGPGFLKVEMGALPSRLTVIQTEAEFSVTCPQEPLGFLRILCTDSILHALDGNYLMVRSGPLGSSFGASLSGVRKAGYATGPEGRLDLELGSSEPFNFLVDNESSRLRAKLQINPLPSSFSIGMANLLGSSGPRVPDLMNATSVLGFSSAVFGIADMAADILSMAGRVGGFLESQFSGLGLNTSLTLKTTSDTILIGDIQKGNITEAPWTHGIVSRLLASPSGKENWFSAKVFLRLARETSLSSRTEGDLLRLSLEMKGFKPRFDWALVDLQGMGGRDILAYLTGLGTTLDLRLGANITQNVSYGRDLVDADLDVELSSPAGPFLATLSRPAPQNTRFLVLTPQLPAQMHLEAYLAERMALDYRASQGLEHAYIKNSRLVRDQWRSSAVLLHDLPGWLNASLDPPARFDGGGPPTQVLPEFSMSAERGSFDIYVDLDGKASGQRTSYQLEVKDGGKSTTGKHSGRFYKIRSSGAEAVNVRARDFPYKKGLTITALGAYLEEVQSLDITVDMVFGAYPVFKLSAMDVEAFHLSLRTKLNIAGQEREGRLVLADSKSQGGVPLGLGIYSNGLALGRARGEEHAVVPMPLLSLIATLLGG